MRWFLETNPVTEQEFIKGLGEMFYLETSDAYIKTIFPGYHPVIIRTNPDRVYKYTPQNKSFVEIYTPLEDLAESIVSDCVSLEDLILRTHQAYLSLDKLTVELPLAEVQITKASEPDPHLVQEYTNLIQQGHELPEMIVDVYGKLLEGHAICKACQIAKQDLVTVKYQIEDPKIDLCNFAHIWDSRVLNDITSDSVEQSLDELGNLDLPQEEIKGYLKSIGKLKESKQLKEATEAEDSAEKIKQLTKDVEAGKAGALDELQKMLAHQVIYSKGGYKQIKITREQWKEALTTGGIKDLAGKAGTIDSKVYWVWQGESLAVVAEINPITGAPAYKVKEDRYKAEKLEAWKDTTGVVSIFGAVKKTKSTKVTVHQPNAFPNFVAKIKSADAKAKLIEPPISTVQTLEVASGDTIPLIEPPKGFDSWWATIRNDPKFGAWLKDVFAKSEQFLGGNGMRIFTAVPKAWLGYMKGLTAGQYVYQYANKHNLTWAKGQSDTEVKRALGASRRYAIKESINTDAEYLEYAQQDNLPKCQEMVEQRAKEEGYTLGPLFHGSRNNTFTEFNAVHGAYFTTNQDYAEGFRDPMDRGNPGALYRVFLNPGRILDYDGQKDKDFTTFTGTRTASLDLIEKGYDSERLLMGNGEYDMRITTPNQIKSADPITYDDNGDVIPLSRRFNSTSNDLRESRNNGLSEDLHPYHKARDEEYLKAVEAGDLKRCQEMVDDEAHGKGYEVGPVYHGTKRTFKSFEHTRDYSKLFYFSFDKEFANSYARGYGGHRKPSEEIQQRIDKTYAKARIFATELKAGEFAKYGDMKDWSLDILGKFSSQVKNYEKSLLDGMTVTQAMNGMGIQVISAYLKADRIFDPTKDWEEFKSLVIKTTGHESEDEVNETMWAYIKAGNYLIWENKELVDAILQKYDALLVAEGSESGVQTIAIRDSWRIKRTDPITYDDNGDVISLSKRFNSTSNDLRESIEAPKKTITAYKLFRTLKTKPGEIFPLFIGKTIPTPIGEWVEAESLPTKGYAFRPGWHSGILPTAPHLCKKDGTMAKGRVWAEIEVPADVNWQDVADQSKTKDIRGEIPKGGYYRFKTSKLQGGAWIISGAIKVNKILTSEEVKDILDVNNITEVSPIIIEIEFLCANADILGEVKASELLQKYRELQQDFPDLVIIKEAEAETDTFYYEASAFIPKSELEDFKRILKYRGIEIDIIHDNEQEITESMELSNEFNIEELNSLTSFRARIRYCQERLQRISSGSARIVYKLDDNKVLKLASNSAGIAQNGVEIDLSNDYVFTGYGISAEVYEYHEDNLWLEMEYCTKLHHRRFKQVTEIDFKTFQDALIYMGSLNNRYRNPPEPDVDWDNEFLSDVVSYMGDYGIPYPDLAKISTYRENRDGDIVMVDFGFNEEVFKQYYESIKESADYRGQHTAPNNDSGSPMYDVTKNETYPDDVYSYNGVRYYGVGYPKMDAKAFDLLLYTQGKPNQTVKIYRAVPKDIVKAKIQEGDWVTIVRAYAVEHGRSALNGDYHIISKTVRANEIFTDGDSWLEWGYSVQKEITESIDTQNLPEVDSAYMKAVEAGDIEKCQELVDAQARMSGYDIGPVYHGTPDGRFLKSGPVFKPEKERFGMGNTMGVHWFAGSRDTARTYADYRRAFDYQNSEPMTISAFLKIDNPLIIDAQGGYWRTVQKMGQTTNVIDEAIEKGNDGIIIERVQDNYNTDTNRPTKPTTTYAVFSSNQIKWSDPITYDDNGNVIPLSQRFNTASVDIRESIENTYQVIPPHEMTQEEFCSPTPIIPGEDEIILYHRLRSEDDLDSVLKNGLTRSFKPHANPPGVLWFTTVPDGYSSSGTLLYIKVKRDDTAVNLTQYGKDQAGVLRDIKPEEIVYVDKHAYSPVSPEYRIEFERDSDYSKQYHRAYIELALSNNLPVPDEVLQDYPELLKDPPEFTYI